MNADTVTLCMYYRDVNVSVELIPRAHPPGSLSLGYYSALYNIHQTAYNIMIE